MTTRTEDAAEARAIIEAAQAATGLSQVGLARALGVWPQSLRRWLAGDAPMGEPERRLCRAYTIAPELVGALGEQV